MNEKDAGVPPQVRDSVADRPRRRWLAVVLVGLLIVLVLAVAGAPTLLSTGAGKSWVEAAINGAIRGSVRIGSWSLNWTTGQRIDGLELLDPEGQSVLRLDSFVTELTLLDALRQRINLGSTEISGLSAAVVVGADGVNNLSRALETGAPAQAESSGPILLPVTGNLRLAPARITVAAPGMETVAFEPLTASLLVASADQPMALEVRGESRQGDLAGSFSVTGQILDLIDSAGELRPDQARIELHADVRDLPVDGVDRVLGLNGVLTAALGQRANLTADISGSATEQRLTVAGTSPNAEINLQGEVAAGRFTLSAPALLRLSVTPALVNALAGADPGGEGLRLRETFGVKVALARLDMSLTDFAPGTVAVDLSVDQDRPARFTGPAELGEVTLRGMTASLESTGLAERIAFTAKGEAVSQKKPGRFDVQGELRELFDGSGAIQPDKLQVNATAGVHDLPTALVDRLSGQQGLLVALLGPTINLDLSAKSSGADRIDASLQIDAGALTAKNIALSIQDSIGLTAPAVLNYTIAPALLPRLLGDGQGPALGKPATVRLEVSKFSAPRPKAGETLLQPERIAVDASLTSGPLLLTGLPDLGQLNVSDLRVALDANDLTAVKISLRAAVSESRRGLLGELGASPLAIELDASTGLNADLSLAALASALRLKSQGLSAQAQVRLPGDFSSAALSEPAELTVLLTPALLQRFGAASPGQPTLAKPAAVAVTLEKLNLSLAPFSLNTLDAMLIAAVDEIVIGGIESVAGTALRKAQLKLEYTGAQGTVATSLKAQTHIPGRTQAGAVDVNAKLSEVVRDGAFDLGAARIDGSANIADLPSALIDALSGQSGVSALLGESVNITAKAASSGGEKPKVNLDLGTQSARLTADLGLVLADDLALTRPGQLRLTLTPAAWKAWTGAPGDGGKADAALDLAADAEIEVRIDTLKWPLVSPADGPAFDAARAALAARVTSPRIELRDRQSGQDVDIEVFSADIAGSRLDQAVTLTVAGKVRGAAAAGDPGKMELGIKVADFLGPAGEPQTEALSLDIKGQIQQFPVALADRLLDMGGLATASLGHSADVIVETSLVKLQGPIGLTLRSDYASSVIAAELRDSVLVLRKPLTAELLVTPELGKLVLSNIHPIFETTESAEQPIRLEIPSDQVRIPTTDFDIAKVVVPRIKLDLGKINLRSGWLLKGLVGVAQQFGRLDSAGREQWTAWFTPAWLQLRDGRISYDRRLDLLLDERLHLATWGVADISRDRADLVIAFMPETLERVFRLEVAENDALHMPMTGPLSDPAIDFKKAAADLGRLRAQRSLSRKEPLVGALLGAVASGATSAGGPMPPASVEPLPWGSLPEAPAQDAPTEPAQAAPDEAPAPRKSTKEQAIEGLINILRNPK